MPTVHQESHVAFTFPDGWAVARYDTWTWYRKHFQACADSAAVDFLAVSPDGGTCWLVEVKDFTTSPPDVAKGPLHDIITRKVRDTLAGILAASLRAEPAERGLATSVKQAATLRVAFHCEQPTHLSKLFKNLPDHADLQQKLRQTLRPVDTKAIVYAAGSVPDAIPWSATWNPNPQSSP